MRNRASAAALVANATLVDGRWLAAGRYACGITALAGLGCDVVAPPVTTTLAP